MVLIWGILVNTSPIFVLILSPLMVRESITKLDVAAAVLAFLGTSLSKSIVVIFRYNIICERKIFTQNYIVIVLYDTISQ